jgi:hypothetical protein
VEAVLISLVVTVLGGLLVERWKPHAGGPGLRFPRGFARRYGRRWTIRPA